MMKKFWYLAMIMLCAMVATSCGDDDDEEVDVEWAKLNQEAFFTISANKEYKALKSQSNAGSIYYKVLKEGTGTERIYYNSTVKCYYTGSYVVTYKSDKINVKAGDVFDSAEPPYQNAVDFPVKSVVDGFSTALQNMHVGDRWEIWMNSNMGYGSSSSSSGIPAYTTLKFEVEVVEIVEP
ncbi:FKBP-type peptidyl-prolyl cis-trans isomerase [Parabacteroides sp. PF5-6]|uniref:FKBP-type peptidyl-prolyl cis-trans isomerase n=1 Tax=Parabacteroides sp. PF5-6 TaxID=1742403 RepID=UPI00240515D8|nr:FKBP-type peptidyl-prolyl cis-trans isomerase [Parabacteroides sp. PF5-6]MDF9830935.1 FKBP-type peptidyl-prolyl cis-trans isomerase [Parabacteroides sp. PF5-6]